MPSSGSEDEHLGNGLLYVRLDVRLWDYPLQTVRLGHSLQFLRLCLACVILLKLQQRQNISPCCQSYISTWACSTFMLHH